MKRKIIFLGYQYQSNSGGKVVASMNRAVLTELFENNVQVVLFPSGFSSASVSSLLRFILSSILRRLVSRQKSRDEHEIIYTYIDHSALGWLSALSGRLFRSYKVICHFHNVEYDYYRLQRGYSGYLKSQYVRFCERKALLNSDIIIALTERDSHRLREIYGRKADYIHPVSVFDQFYLDKSKTGKHSRDYHLFVGSPFYYNIKWIRWYILNVLPKMKTNLYVVGLGWDKLLSDLDEPKLVIHGFVDNLRDLYLSALFVVNPVQEGSGMKTKTIEAFMFGKFVLGAPEAFVGTEKSELNIKCVCNTITDYVKSEKELMLSEDIEALEADLRSNYLNHYSYESARDRFRILLKMNPES